MLRVAVKLPAAPRRIGDYVADVTALEAAGADTIWLDASSATSSEPWILLGAMAAVAHRVRLGVIVGPGPEWREAVNDLGRLTGGRVVVGTRPGAETGTFASAIQVLCVCGTQGEAAAAAQLAEGVILPGGDDEVRLLRAGGDFEIWIDALVPADRTGWTNMVVTLETAGATGVIVPWDPRIIDLLRNAGDPDDRTDLLIATG
jgi:hypothetical protein